MKVTCINSLFPLLSSSLPSSEVSHLTVPSDVEGVKSLTGWYLCHVCREVPSHPLDPMDRPVESPMTLSGCWLGRKAWFSMTVMWGNGWM